jgi:hypothetical protein
MCSTMRTRCIAHNCQRAARNQADQDANQVALAGKEPRRQAEAKHKETNGQGETEQQAAID